MIRFGSRGSRSASVSAQLTSAYPSLQDIFEKWLFPQDRLFRNWGVSHGWPYVATGGSRIVFRLNATQVVKFAIPDAYGEAHNQTEAEVWALADSTLRVHLTPVRDLGPSGQWLIMDFVKTPGTIEDEEAHALLTEDYGIEDVPFVGEENENVSADGRLVDYAQVEMGRFRQAVSDRSRP